MSFIHICISIQARESDWKLYVLTINESISVITCEYNNNYNYVSLNRDESKRDASKKCFIHVTMYSYKLI